MHDILEFDVYHGTDMKSAKDIQTNGYFVKEPRQTDDHWLGHGIYFYEFFELAKWWADAKTTSQSKKRGVLVEPAVIKSTVSCAYNQYCDLDNPFKLNELYKFVEETEKQIREQGVVLDFTKGLCKSGDSVTKDAQRKVRCRERCYFIDLFKYTFELAVIKYTFSKNNPSYADYVYACQERLIYGLRYNEKQICVTSNEYVTRSKQHYPKKEAYSHGEQRTDRKNCG